MKKRRKIENISTYTFCIIIYSLHTLLDLKKPELYTFKFYIQRRYCKNVDIFKKKKLSNIK